MEKPATPAKEARVSKDEAVAMLAKVGIKVNMQMRTDNIRRIGGRRQELVDDDVLRAALRLLRERTDADLFVIDTSTAPAGPWREIALLNSASDWL